MQLDLTRFTGTTVHLERRYEPEAFPPDEEYRLLAPVSLSCDVTRADDRYTLTGRIDATLGLDCSRCTAAVSCPIDVVFDLTYLPERAADASDEVEVAEEDLSVAYHAGDVIDLGHLMREQFTLALPMKPLCHDDCRGLCPTCGVDRNTTTCTCTPTWTDPRLDGLKTLLRTNDDA